jgi:tetratricopeptide (TPR) repeat protein
VDAKELPKRQPQASTCVAFGTFHLKAAVEMDRTPAQRQELLDQARRSYQQALKVDPKCLDAYHGLARTYLQMGDREHMVATFDEAVKKFPNDASFPFELGMSLARLKDWNPALAGLQAACALDPENRTYANALAYTLARAGRYDDSVACFRKTVSEAQARYNVARMLHHLQQDELSKEHLRLALAAQPDMPGALQLLNELEHPGASRAEAATAAVGFETFDDLPPLVTPDATLSATAAPEHR